ncbi:F-box protein CPR1-like [Papaver somniferum]|uniref:F-box protein CPR1-like n=1 Tax=Papaver somniferum TaxID=3469 RepID=UPI000E6F876C|nr:F-box protein CPR1-like [Papaver somniferum]
MYVIFSIDYDQSSSLFSSNEKVVEVVDSAFKGRRVQILGSCNGLFFIKVCQGTVTALWNPATKEYKAIGTSNIKPVGFRNRYHSPRIHGWVLRYGFGYDYKLVSIVSPCNEDIAVAEVEVYTLGSISWKRLEYISYKVKNGPPGVFVNGALHWLANPFPARSENAQVLLAFNVAEETFSEVPQLEIFDDNKKFEHKRVAIVEGYLSMLCSHSNLGFEVWVMSDYGVRDSWTTRYTISRFKIDVILSFRYIRRIQSLKNGEMLLEIELDEANKYAKYSALVFYDPKHEKSRLVDIDFEKYNRNWNNSSNLRTRFYTETSVESLVSLLLMSVVDKKNQIYMKH